jgi:hypothetical protein
MISKLIKKTGPLQCGIYNLGQLSKQYVLIRLGRPTKIGVKRGYYFFSELKPTSEGLFIENITVQYSEYISFQFIISSSYIEYPITFSIIFLIFVNDYCKAYHKLILKNQHITIKH